MSCGIEIHELIDQNPLTGIVEETFETPYSKEHKIGGREQVILEDIIRSYNV